MIHQKTVVLSDFQKKIIIWQSRQKKGEKIGRFLFCQSFHATFLSSQLLLPLRQRASPNPNEPQSHVANHNSGQAIACTEAWAMHICFVSKTELTVGTNISVGCLWSALWFLWGIKCSPLEKKNKNKGGRTMNDDEAVMAVRSSVLFIWGHCACYLCWP